MLQQSTMEEEAQANLPEPLDEEPNTMKIRPLERIIRHPKVPPEPSAYGKYKNYSRPWILQDGREPPKIGSEMRDRYRMPKKAKPGEGIRKRMLTDFFWEQMLDEMIEVIRLDSTSEKLYERLLGYHLLSSLMSLVKKL